MPVTASPPRSPRQTSAPQPLQNRNPPPHTGFPPRRPRRRAYDGGPWTAGGRFRTVQHTLPPQGPNSRRGNAAGGAGIPVSGVCPAEGRCLILGGIRCHSGGIAWSQGRECTHDVRRESDLPVLHPGTPSPPPITAIRNYRGGARVEFARMQTRVRIRHGGGGRERTGGKASRRRGRTTRKSYLAWRQSSTRTTETGLAGREAARDSREQRAGDGDERAGRVCSRLVWSGPVRSGPVRKVCAQAGVGAGLSMAGGGERARKGEVAVFRGLFTPCAARR